MNVLMIDVGGSNVKFMNSRDGEMRKLKSGTELTAQAMVEGVLEATSDWEFDKISIGFPGLVTGGLSKGTGIDPSKVQINIQPPPGEEDEPPPPSFK